jgi:hypothetical protein
MIIAIMTIDIEKLIALPNRKNPVGEEAQWDHRLMRLAFPDDEPGHQHDPDHQWDEYVDPTPATSRSGAIHSNQDRCRRSKDQHCTSQSMAGFRFAFGRRRRLRLQRMRASIPNGMLIQKIQCQVR